MALNRIAIANWKGSIKEGKGTLTTESNALDHVKFSWSSRFENKKGTNPEELLASAHAACFTMKLVALLNKAGFNSVEIETKAEILLEKEITQSHLIVLASVDGIEDEEFQQLAENAKLNCPVSKALKIKVVMESALIAEKFTV